MAAAPMDFSLLPMVFYPAFYCGMVCATYEQVFKSYLGPHLLLAKKHSITISLSLDLTQSQFCCILLAKINHEIIKVSCKNIKEKVET